MQSRKVKCLNIVCSVLCMLVFLLGIFCFLSKSTDVEAYAVITEDKLTNVTDLVGYSEDEVKLVSTNLISAPFNNRKNEFMPGNAFIPTYDNEKTYEVDTKLIFTHQNEYLNENQAIYLWVFIPDNMGICPYDLKLSLILNGDFEIVWEFLNASLDVMCEKYSSNAVDYGWKLFELKLADAKSKPQNLDSIIKSQTLNSLRVEFIKNTGDVSSGNSDILSKFNVADSLAIYHIFMAEETNDDSGIVSSLNYSAAKYKQSFIDKLNSIYLNDKLSVLGSSEIFEYAYVGKEDISNKLLAGWSIDVSINGSLVSYDFGNEIKFQEEGLCNIIIKYKQMFHNSSITVLKMSTSIYVEKFGLGKFQFKNQTIKDNESKQIMFNLSSGFELTSDIEVISSDNSVLDVTYYVNENIVYITLKGKSGGNAKVTIQASGKRIQADNQNGAINTNFTLSESMEVTVNSTASDRFTQIFLWSLLAIFVVTLLIFMLISVVKARSNSVK